LAREPVMIRFLAFLFVLTGASAASAETIAIGGTTRHYTVRQPDRKPAPRSFRKGTAAICAVAQGPALR